jgi:hypothetical protein
MRFCEGTFIHPSIHSLAHVGEQPGSTGAHDGLTRRGSCSPQAVHVLPPRHGQHALDCPQGAVVQVV